MSVLCPFCNHYWVLHGIAGCGYTSAGGRCTCEMSQSSMRRSPTEYPLPDAIHLSHSATAFVDHEARAMIAALQARVDALEKAREAGPMLCECGHEQKYHDPHRLGGVTGCGAPIGAHAMCGCRKWRPVPQVTP